MNAPATTGAVGIISRSTELGELASPGRLQRPARLYAVVVEQDGAAGPRRFLADLPEGSAVFALAAPGVSFLLVEHGASADRGVAGGRADRRHRHRCLVRSAALLRRD